MEPPKSPLTQTFFLGDYEVVEASALGIKIHFGHGVTITIHVLGKTSLKPGDKLPLYTRIPYERTS